MVCTYAEIDKQNVDLLLSEHVLTLHSGTTVSSSVGSVSGSSTISSHLLSENLKLQPGEILDHLPHPLFRKFIAYAQKYVNPVLSEDAKFIIKNFYLKLRKQFRYGNCTTIATRHLNSLIRLTQARAKIELRQEATKEDALNTVEITKHSLIDLFRDDAGILDTSRSQNRTGTSSKNLAVKLLTLLQQRADYQAKPIFTRNEIQELARNIGVTEKIRVINILESLNIQGFLLKKSNNSYQLVSS